MRYAYYRRCQVFRMNGQQCKAPAEKGSQICHAHASQLTTAVRRERERRAVLAEAVAEMRRRGKPECGMADLFTDFKGIQVTLAVMAQALIDGRIDCKTAGQLVVHLQTMSKLLWMVHRKSKSTTEARRHGEDPKLPQICADERRLNLLPRINTDRKKLPKAPEFHPNKPKPGLPGDPELPKIAESENQKQLTTGTRSKADEVKKPLPLINIDHTDRKKPGAQKNRAVAFPAGRAPVCASARILQFEVTAFRDGSRAHGPPESKAA